jgi:E3 ubiquitin-protein ligase MARCH6
MTDSVLPVHWSSNEPVLEFPVDLLFYNFLMPFAVKFFKPSEGLQKIYAWWFRISARTLRLSSFMFGERKNDEEGYTYHPSWTSICMLQKADAENPVLPGEFGPLDQVHFRRTGRFVRAPASDSVRRLKGTAVFLPVDESNRRLDIHPSLDPLNGPTGANNPEWRLVYLPPMFKLRLTLVVVGIWGFTAATGVGITIGPLLLGRYILGRLVPPNVRLNDIYAFSVGLYITAGAVFCLSKLPTIYQKAISTFGPITAVPATSPSMLQKLQQFLLRTAKVSYVLTAFAIVIPTLVAMIIEFYVIIPLHTAFGEAATPSTSAAVPLPPPQPSGEQQLGNRVHTLHFVQDWTLGVLYVKMMGRMMLLDDTSPWARSLRGIIQQGWLNPDVRLATKVFHTPWGGGNAQCITAAADTGTRGHCARSRGGGGSVQICVPRGVTGGGDRGRGVRGVESAGGVEGES